MSAVNDLRSKVAYLQGLAEGLDLSAGSPEGRVLHSMLGVLVDLADQVTTMEDAQQELAEYVEDVDYDLGALEEEIYSGPEEGNLQYIAADTLHQDDEGIDLTCCPECGEPLAAGAGEIETELDVICPNCGCMVCEEFVDAPEADID